jgi:hypothetical protein
MIRHSTPAKKSASKRTGSARKATAAAVSTTRKKPAAKLKPGQAKFNAWLADHSRRMYRPQRKKLLQIGTALWAAPGQNLSVADLAMKTGMAKATITRLLNKIQASKTFDRVNGHVFVSEYFVENKKTMQAAKSKLLAAEAKRTQLPKSFGRDKLTADQVFERFHLLDFKMIKRLLAITGAPEKSKARVARNAMLFVDAGLPIVGKSCVNMSPASIKVNIRRKMSQAKRRAEQIEEVKQLGLWESKYIREGISEWKFRPNPIIKGVKLFVNAGLPVNTPLIRQSKTKINAFIRERVAEHKRNGVPLVPDVDAVFEKYKLMDNPRIKAAVEARASRWFIVSKALLFEQAGLEPRPRFILNEPHKVIIRHIALTKAAK